MAEKYPDFGGYIYTFNNPVRFIDPDGNDPKPVYNGFSNVLNVLSGKKWIPYMSKTIQESEWNFSWGKGFYKQTSYRTGECADYSRLQVNQGSTGKYFSDGADGNIPYNQNKQPARYILTEVRDNE